MPPRSPSACTPTFLCACAPFDPPLSTLRASVGRAGRARRADGLASRTGPFPRAASQSPPGPLRTVSPGRRGPSPGLARVRTHTSPHNRSTELMSKHIAVVGLGSMGGAMAATLLRAGWRVRGFDPAPAARSAAGEEGVEVVEDLDRLAGTPYVLLSLPSARVVEATVPVLLARRGTRAVVDTTTSEPGTSAEVAALAAEQGVAFVDAPVSGGREGAAAGRLTAFVGAEPDALDAARPVLDALTGGRYRHLGAPGAGNVVKLLNNVLAAVNLVAVGEALAVAKAYGVDPAAAAAGISGASGASKASAVMYPDWVLTGTYDSGFALGLMARDAALAVETAGRRGATPHLLAAASHIWQEALAALGPDADFTEIARTVAPSLTSEGATAA
ncbi:NAD(P)-dependent oxidoreductase [Streptomyces sp. NPDC014685]|uniref:NAD(P)-dependent oxidoreductase n=1 Tax=Streptomyces sp. NPDC014685 TaxID=3364881 RepID=UPI0036FC8900